MAYASKEDLELAIGATTLLQLCDDEAVGSWDAVNTDRLNHCITQAGRDVDGYCRTRFVVPFVVTPPMVGRLAVSLAIWYLYRRRRAAFGVPEDVKDEHNLAVRQLERINEGKLDPGVEPEPATSTKDLLTYDGPDQLFTSDTLEDF
jgi:phage gp36-like protein